MAREGSARRSTRVPPVVLLACVIVAAAYSSGLFSIGREGALTNQKALWSERAPGGVSIGVDAQSEGDLKSTDGVADGGSGAKRSKIALVMSDNRDISVNPDPDKRFARHAWMSNLRYAAEHGYDMRLYLQV